MGQTYDPTMGVSGIGLPTRAIIAAGLALVPPIFLSLPYWYYQLLRVGVFGVGAWCAFVALASGWRRLGVGCVAVAVLFNPIVPIYLSRTAWRFIDFALAIAIWMLWFLIEEDDRMTPFGPEKP